MSIEETWKKYKQNEDEYCKQKLIENYVFLVKIVAGRLYNHHGGTVEFDDLLSYGIFGLIDAIEKFDITRNLKFETYAQIRIRGSIIDNLRKLDWIPRTVRKKTKLYETTVKKLENEFGRSVTLKEVANELQIKEKEVQDILMETSTTKIISLEELISSKGDVVFDNDMKETPDNIYLEKEIKELLKLCIDKLSDKEKLVISMYYYEELTYKEIGAVLNLSESRISQINSKSLQLIKEKLKNIGVENI